MTATQTGEVDLATRWADFREQHPKLRIRDAARELGVTEVELVATQCGHGNVRLESDFPAMLHALEDFGHCLAITRNDAAVHETQGCYDNLRFHGSVGMFFRPGIDTRFFLEQWNSAFAVNENQRLSIQFFDLHGVAAHKVYITDRSNEKAYWEFAQRFRSDNQSAAQIVQPRHKSGKSTAATKLDVDALRQAWNGIRDVHEGNSIIKAHGGDHQAVYRALGHEYALPLQADAVETLLEKLAGTDVEPLIFVMNDTAVQVFGGPIQKLLRTGPWFNILDPEFNLHLKTGEIGNAWFIRKPSEDGWVTTLDVFDKHGHEIVLFAANRQRGEAEPESWTAVLDDITQRFRAVAPSVSSTK